MFIRLDKCNNYLRNYLKSFISFSNPNEKDVIIICAMSFRIFWIAESRVSHQLLKYIIAYKYLISCQIERSASLSSSGQLWKYTYFMHFQWKVGWWNWDGCTCGSYSLYSGGRTLNILHLPIKQIEICNTYNC